MDLIVDTAVIGVVPGIVEVAKRAGMPTRFAGLAAIVVATMLIVFSNLGQSETNIETFSVWMMRGVVTGLAASGLYSHAARFRTPA